MTGQTDTRTRRAKRLARTRGRPQRCPRAQPKTAADPTLDALNIPERYRDELASAGIARLSQLRAFGDLTAIKGIGPKSALEIEQAVQAWLSQ